MIRLRDVCPRKGYVMREWGPKQASAVDLLVKQGLVDWQSAPDSYPGRGRYRHRHFGGLHITLTKKGQLIAKRRVTP